MIGFKVSRKGEEATSTRNEELSVTSKYSAPKVKVKADPPHFGSIHHKVVSDPAVGEYVLKEIKHGYGRTPMVIVYYDHNLSASIAESSGVLPFGTAPLNLWGWRAKADSEKVQIMFERNFSFGGSPQGEEVDLRYYIFAEKGM